MLLNRRNKYCVYIQIMLQPDEHFERQQDEQIPNIGATGMSHALMGISVIE